MAGTGAFAFVGDGVSDRCIALAANRVFARAGLATWLDRQGVPYEPFEDFFDVAAALRTGVVSPRARSNLGAMEVRRAGSDDLPVLEQLYRDFFAEVPPSAHDHVDVEHELGEVREIVDGGQAFVAEDDGAVLGFALMQRRSPLLVELTDLYVRPDARSRGVASALVRAAISAQDGDAEYVNLEGQGGQRRGSLGVPALGLPRRPGRDGRAPRAAPAAARTRAPRDLVRVGARADGRPRVGGARCRRVRASHPLERHTRGRAAERLDDRVRRCGRR